MRQISSILAGIALVAASHSTVDAEPRVGMMTDLGVPEGFSAALAVSPAAPLVTHVGAVYNGAGPGARIGLRLESPTHAAAPYVSLDVGAFPETEANDWLRRLGPSEVEIDRLGYVFGSAHIGLRLGSPNASIYVQGGVSVVRGTFHTTETRGMAPEIEIETATPFTARAPSGRLGLIGFF